MDKRKVVFTSMHFTVTCHYVMLIQLVCYFSGKKILLITGIQIVNKRFNWESLGNNKETSFLHCVLPFNRITRLTFTEQTISKSHSPTEELR